MAEQRKVRQARRSALAAGLSLVLLLGGCGIVSDAGARQSKAKSSRPKAKPVVQGEAPRQPVLPQADPHRVAVLVPLTGADASVGRSIANAAHLAVAERGKGNIRISIYDTAVGAAAAANQALAQGNRFILGPLLSEDVRAAAPIARAAGVPVVAFSNDASVAGNGVYLMGFVPGQSIERVVAYARSQGVQRFAGLIPAGVYGERARQALVGAVERSGGSVVAVQSYSRSPAAIRAAARRLNALPGYEAVLIADTARLAALAAPFIRRGTRVLGTELWGTEANLSDQRALHGAWYAAAPGGSFGEFGTRYRVRFGSEPHRLASLGYDAMVMTGQIAAGWAAGEPVPERALRMQGFSGMDGPFRFWSDGVADRSLEVQQIGPDGVTTVSSAVQPAAR